MKTTSQKKNICWNQELENMLNYSRLVEMDKLVEKLVSILTEKKFITKEIENSDIDFDTKHTYQSIAAASEQEAIDECYIIKVISLLIIKFQLVIYKF